MNNLYNEKTIDSLKSAYENLLKDLPQKLKQITIVKNDLTKIRSVILEKRYNEIDMAYDLINETYQIKGEIQKQEEELLQKKKSRKYIVREIRWININIWYAAILGTLILGVIIYQIYRYLTN